MRTSSTELSTMMCSLAPFWHLSIKSTLSIMPSSMTSMIEELPPLPMDLLTDLQYKVQGIDVIKLVGTELMNFPPGFP